MSFTPAQALYLIDRLVREQRHRSSTVRAMAAEMDGEVRELEQRLAALARALPEPRSRSGGVVRASRCRPTRWRRAAFQGISNSSARCGHEAWAVQEDRPRARTGSRDSPTWHRTEEVSTTPDLIDATALPLGCWLTSLVGPHRSVRFPVRGRAPRRPRLRETAPWHGQVQPRSIPRLRKELWEGEREVDCQAATGVGGGSSRRVGDGRKHSGRRRRSRCAPVGEHHSNWSRAAPRVRVCGGQPSTAGVLDDQARRLRCRPSWKRGTLRSGSRAAGSGLRTRERKRRRAAP